MLKRFKTRKPYTYKELTVPEGCRELTDEEAFKINGGGKSVENSNEGVANAQPGDTVTRNDKTTVTLTQGDIDWAKEHVGTSGGASSTTTNPATTTPSTAQNGAGAGSAAYNGSSSSGSSNSNATPTNAAADTSTRVVSVQYGSNFGQNKPKATELEKLMSSFIKEPGILGTSLVGNYLIQKELTPEGLIKHTIIAQKVPKRLLKSRPKSTNWGQLKTSAAVQMRMQDYKTYINEEDEDNQKEINAKNEQMNGGYSFSSAGCKMCATAKFASEVAGHKVERKQLFRLQ